MNNTEKSLKEKTLRAFDKVLEPLYFNLEASEAEDLHVKIAEKAIELIEQAKRETVETFKQIVRKESNLRIAEPSDEYERGFDYGYDMKTKEILDELKSHLINKKDL